LTSKNDQKDRMGTELCAWKKGRLLGERRISLVIERIQSLVQDP
jgi:hypothetical protein